MGILITTPASAPSSAPLAAPGFYPPLVDIAAHDTTPLPRKGYTALVAPIASHMTLLTQTVGLIQAARHLCESMSADAILLLTEQNLDWAAVRELIGTCKLLVAAHDPAVIEQLRAVADLTVLAIDPGPANTQDRLSHALLTAVANDKLRGGSHVIALYNGIEVQSDRPEPVDSLSVIHMGEHLERLSAQDLRTLTEFIPLDVMRAVVDVATEIGREGREGKPVGTMFVVGDTRKVLSMSRQLNFNPFKGYARKDRDIRDRRVREQIKDLAQLEGAIVIRHDGIALSACTYITAPAEGITLSKGLGTRHWAAAAISKQTKAIAVAVSQSSGTVRIFHEGKVSLHIEPFTRPMIWQRFRMDEGADPNRGG